MMDARNWDRSRRSFGPSALRSPKTALKAFTLVEVALTLGIVTFALIAIFSLISVSLKNSRDANVRQGLTLAMDQTISLYQGQNFTNALAMVQAQTNFYFDNGGLPLANSTGAFFKSAVTNVAMAGAATNYLIPLQLKMTWPNSAPTSTNFIVFSILNQQ